MELLTVKELQEELVRKEKQIEDCTKMISKHDKMISKLYHQIEFDNSYNASKGYKAYADLRNVLKARRKWKDSRPKLIVEHRNIQKRIAKIEKLRKRKVNRVIKKKDWSKKFTPEGNAILKGISV